ncbi:unnamed protein product, partial [Laminaria digitata]
MASMAMDAAPRGCRGRQVCLEAMAALDIDHDDVLQSRVLRYLSFIDELQLSADGDGNGDGDENASAARQCSASAIFLALYDQPADGEMHVMQPPGSDVASDDGGGGGGGSSDGDGSCRLGDLLRQCNTGVKNFMEHLTLLAGRLPPPLSERLLADLRVMKEGIVVTKLLHVKYVQIWEIGGSGVGGGVGGVGDGDGDDGDDGMRGSGDEGDSGDGDDDDDGDDGGDDDGDDGDMVSPSGEGDDAAAAQPLSPPSDPQALPRLGWYLYLLTKDVLGFRSSNASFMRCLNLVLAALGAVVWNSSPRYSSSSFSSSSSSAHASPQRMEAAQRPEGAESGSGLGGGGVGGVASEGAVAPEKEEEEEEEAIGIDVGVGDGVGEASECGRAAGGGGGGGGGGSGGGGGCGGSSGGGDVGGIGDSDGDCGYGGEAALLVALSACGKCPADEVRAMSARVVEVIEVLLQEGIVVSHHSSCSTPNPAAAAPGGDEAAEGGVETSPEAADHRGASPVGVEAGVGPPREGDVAGFSLPVAGRAERVAGVFHASVAAENASRLDRCYWSRVSERAGRGGVGVLDEAFVLTPGLRDTVGTPRPGGRTALTPSVSRTSRQLFQDYQKASATSAGDAKAAAGAGEAGENTAGQQAVAGGAGAGMAGMEGAAAAAEAAAAGMSGGFLDSSFLPGGGVGEGGGFDRRVGNGHGGGGGGSGVGGGVGFSMLESPLARSRLATGGGVPG